ncbi:MCE family protein [Nocardioides sp. TRM66260-LWL]|uniref:MCE family protein n=1 Tax=Nocardioides sp. TRM66260-LWL TaxID=2874478 RepID=UPI001CC3A949|nr:MlaD family protein [Nocardioides sp. TRM66260-LWL]MBZ5736291.1 MCE family protein [Nocardioides sp. TRM66260-LWL]
MTAGTRRIAVRFGLFALVSVLLGTILVNTMVDPVSGDTRSYSADFTDVSGLRVGDDVRVAGVRVGRVVSIQVEGRDGARVRFDLSDAQPILDTTKIVMRYQNLVGQRYLALVQTGRRGAPLPADAVIDERRTNPGFDLTELLNGFRPLFEVLQPADVNRLATSIVEVLQGEGGTVEQLLQQVTELTTFVADRDQLIGSVLTNLTPVLDSLARQGSRFTATVKELRGLMTGLAQDRRSIGDSIDGVASLVGATSDLLEQARRPATETTRELRRVARTLVETRPQLSAALAAFADLMTRLGRPTSYENALNIYVCTLNLGIGPLSIDPVPGAKRFSEACR